MFASREQTELYKNRAIKEKNVHPSNFREVFDLYLSSIGIGTYPLSDFSSEIDQQIMQATKAAIRSGAVNVIDTSIYHRFHKTEKSVGKAINELIQYGEIERGSILVSTKNGYISPSEEKYFDNMNEYIYEEIINQYICRKEDIVNGKHSLSPSFLEIQLNQSLKNLQLEGIDILYLENPAEEQLDFVTVSEFYERLEYAFNFLEKMRDINHIHWYGISTTNSLKVQPKDRHYLSLERVIEIAKRAGGKDHGFKFIHVPFNYMSHQAVTMKNQYINNTKYSTAQAAEILDIKLMTSTPLNRGTILKSSSTPKFPLLMTKAQQAIQYARSAHKNIASTIIGMKNEEHVKENIKVTTVNIATEEEIEKAF